MSLRAVLAPVLGAVVFVCFLGISAAASTGNPSAGDPAALWVAGKDAALKIDPATSAVQFQLPFTGRKLQSVAVDAINGNVWLYGQKHLEAYSAAGTQLVNVDLPRNTQGGEPDGFVVDGMAGNVWLARHKKLYRFGLNGALIQSIDFPRAISALTLDTNNDQLWVAAGQALHILN